MYEIQLSNNQSWLPINDDSIHSVVSGTLREQKISSAEIAVALVDDATIHRVNREHLQHDYPTDVISFLYDSAEVASQLADDSDLRGAGLHLDGELVVSTETAIREAASYGWDPLDELRLYLVHGLLHLCGYDDLSEDEQMIMRQREQAVLKTWNLVPHYR